MSDLSVRWSKTSSSEGSKGPHKDYDSNLSNARLFCSRVQKSLLNGMNVKICNSEGLINSLLMISFMPPRKAKMGNYATPIFLHDAHSVVNKKIEIIFNIYLNTAKIVNKPPISHKSNSIW